MSVGRLWFWSTVLFHRGWIFPAKLIKLFIFVAFKAVLPYECVLKAEVIVWHRGVGTVVHPNTTMGSGVTIGHGVTIGASSNEPGSELRVVIGDDVTIGAHAYIAGTRGRRLEIGHGARVGAHAVVTRDIASGTVAMGPQATVSPTEKDRMS